jgi:hypothetical protein
MKHNYSTLFFSLFLFFSVSCYAQVPTRKLAKDAFNQIVRFHDTEQPAIFEVQKKILSKKESSNSISDGFVGIPVTVDKGLLDGKWHFSPKNGGNIWKLSLRIKEVKATSIYFDKFFLPEGAEMFVYNKDKTYIFGPVTAHENTLDSTFATDLVKTGDITIEVFEPIYAKNKVIINVGTAMYIDGDGDDGVDGDTQGDIKECNVNVSCSSQGNAWENESKAVAMIFDPLRQRRWCSGVLVNNACHNLSPMFLTAYHCVEWSDGVLDWGSLSPSNLNSVNHFVFRFGYKTTSCSNTSEVISMSLYGADVVADVVNSDVALFKLRQKPASNSDISYAGWSRNQTTGQVTAIHHPQGNPMKISHTDVNSSPVASKSPLSDFPTSALNFWKVFFTEGTVEGGSSGAPYFDQSHRVFATHHASSRDCIERRGNAGKFDNAWNGGLGTHLSDDPSVTTTNTIAIPYLDIPDNLCYNSPMTVVNLPQISGWSLTGASIQGAHLTNWFQSIAPDVGFSGEGFLELQLKPSGITCNDPLILRKTFNVGIAKPDVFVYNYWNCDGWIYVTNVQPGTTYNWTIRRGWQTFYYQNTSSVYLPNMGSGFGNLEYAVVASNACASTYTNGTHQLQGCNGGWYSAKPVDENTGKKHNWKMQLSPNPATNDLNVSLSDYNERQLHTLGDVKIFNMTGQVVYETKQVLEDNMRLNIQSLNNGFYILEVRGEDFATRQRFNVSR